MNNSISTKSRGILRRSPGDSTEPRRKKETKQTRHIHDLSYPLHRISSFLDLQSYNRVRQCSNDIKNVIEESNYHKHVKNVNHAFRHCCSIETIQPYMVNKVTTIRGHTNYVTSVIQLSDGRLVSASYDNTLKVWGSVFN